MIKKSPFEQMHRQLGAEFADYHGWELPKNYGAAEPNSRMLYEKSLAFDLSSFGKIFVKGADSSELIKKLCCTNTNSLEQDKWIWGLICDNSGGLVDIVRIALHGHQYLMEHIKINDQSEQLAMLGIYGPKAVETIDSIVPFHLAHIPSGSLKSISLLMLNIIIVRGSWAGVDGFEIICSGSAANMSAKAIHKYYSPQDNFVAGTDTLQTALIEASLPVSLGGCGGKCGEYENLNPVSMGFSKLIDFGKDFVGKKAIEQIVDTVGGAFVAGVKTFGRTKAAANLKIQYDDSEIGSAERLVYSEKLDCGISIIVADEQCRQVDEEVQIVSDTLIAGGQIVRLPFDSTIAAGIYSKFT